jgi:hypothetical protein
MTDKTTLLHEIRYAERICQRTARLYRRVQALGTWLTVVAGSATLSALSVQVPSWVSATGAVVMALTGAALLAIRPADKAAANEADVRKYASLRQESLGMSESQLLQALDKARLSDVPEIETLRDVAYNDTVTEYGRHDCAVPLRIHQRVLAALA